MALSDYLGSKTADYNYTLTIPCTTELPLTGNKNQIVHEFDDGGVRVAAMSSDSWYDIKIQFDILSKTDADTIFELYNNPNYANGSERTFYWTHPDDGHTYTVRFMSEVTLIRRHSYLNWVEIPQITLRVEGTKP